MLWIYSMHIPWSIFQTYLITGFILEGYLIKLVFWATYFGKAYQRPKKKKKKGQKKDYESWFYKNRGTKKYLKQIKFAKRNASLC